MVNFIHSFFYFTICLGFCFSQGLVDGLVAIVGDNMILHSDALQQAQIYSSSRGVSPVKSPYLFKEIYNESVANMINQFVVLNVAEKDTNIILSNEEVDRALDQRIGDFIDSAGSKDLFEDAVGMSLRQIKLDYWPEIRNMMLIERFKFSKIGGVDVSRVEVVDFYKTYKDSLPSVNENFSFSVLEVPFVSGKQSENRVYFFLDSLRNLIVSGASSFDSLAAIYSQDFGSAASGGKLGFTSRGSLVQAYEEAAYALSPGELSRPVRSQFGFHLIHLIDKRGEKISTQHILNFVPFSSFDKDVVFKKIHSFYKQTKNDPFVFDSLSIEYANTYDNFSGTYLKREKNQISSVFFETLQDLDLHELSLPIETEGGCALVYLYEHEESFSPNVDNAWNLIYQYALQEKQNRTFQALIKKMKNNVYIKVFK